MLGWTCGSRRSAISCSAAGNIIGLPLKVSNEIIGDVDLANRFMAVLQQDFDSFDRSVHPAIKHAVNAAKPLKLGFGAVDVLGKICICGLR